MSSDSEKSRGTARRVWRRDPRRRNRDTRPSIRRGDDGFSFVEVVCAISLIGIVVLPMIGAAYTSIAASSTSRETAEIETVLQNAADRVNRAPVDCQYKIYVEAAALSKGWPASRAEASYQYYEPGSSATVAGTWKPGGCPNGVRTKGLVQLVTVTITNNSGRVKRSVQVVKSDV